MEVEQYAQQLLQQISQKVEQNPTYRKAHGVLQSLLHAARTIPNFNSHVASNKSTTALYITAGTFKLLKKVLEGDQNHQHQLDSYLLLLSMTLPQSSPTALIQAGLLKQLKKLMQIILAKKDNTPLMTRLTVSILSHAYAPEMSSISFQKSSEDRQLLLDLLQRSVASPRSNALSRQCSRLLTHLLKNNQTISAVIAQYAKANLLSSLQQRKELYLSNVKEVMAELPVRLLNDICHRVAANLEQIDCTDQSQEQYLSQTYFFLQKMTGKLLGSTLEDMILVLINVVPGGTMSEKVQLSYLQLLYEATISLVHINQSACNRVLSPVISVLTELLLISPKIAKFASNQLTFILSNCIRPSLWRNKQDELSLEVMKLQQNGKQFTKVLCLFQGLLSTRFSNFKLAAALISIFFNHLQEDAFEQSLTLIHKVVEQRSGLQEKGFRRVMESIILAFGIQNILNLYPLNLEGDIGDESFQDQNNLWLLNVIQKTERAEKMNLYNSYFLPLLQKARYFRQNSNLSKGKREAYGLVEQLIWRCIKPFTKIVDTEVDYEKVLFLIEKQLPNVSQTTLLQLCIALDQLSRSIDQYTKNNNIQFKSKAAEQLIKSLANLLNINSPTSKSILQAIKGLSKIALIDYVQRVFDKNIQKLISLAEQQGIAKQQQKNLKNLQILMAVNSSINLCDPSVTTKYRISREELLLRLVTSLIKSSGSFQKKGYKYISQTLSSAPRSLYLQVMQLLQQSLKIQIGAKHHRLSVISKLWSWIKSAGIQQNLEQLITFIKDHLPQVLLTLRENNKGARQIAVHLIEDFADSMQEMGLLENFVETVCAGLIADRSQMKLSTLNGLSIIIGKGYTSQETFKQMLEIVLLLLQQKKQELYKGVVQFSKKGLLSLPIQNQKTYLPTVLQLLFQQDEEGKMEHRSILRHFLIKMTKKHGKNEIQQMVPQQHRKMLNHALKMQNREKRKKKEQNLARYQQRLLENKQKQNEDDSSSDEEAEAPQKNEAMDIQEPLEELDNANNLLLKYDLDKQRFHFQKQQRGAAPLAKKNQRPTDQITFDDKGIMIIEERKRVRNTDHEEQEQPAQQQAEQPTNFKTKKKVEVHQVKESGESFRTNRAGGDLKLKDKPEPYAFIQFSSKALNKRFKKRAQQVFDALFQKKEGGLRGLKSRIAANR